MDAGGGLEVFPISIDRGRSGPLLGAAFSISARHLLRCIAGTFLHHSQLLRKRIRAESLRRPGPLPLSRPGPLSRWLLCPIPRVHVNFEVLNAPAVGSLLRPCRVEHCSSRYGRWDRGEVRSRLLRAGAGVGHGPRSVGLLPAGKWGLSHMNLPRDLLPRIAVYPLPTHEVTCTSSASRT